MGAQEKILLIINCQCEKNIYIVRPLEYLNLSTGLTVAIYADEGQKNFFINHYHNHYSNEINSNDNATASTSYTITEKEPPIVPDVKAIASRDDDGYFNNTINCDLGTFLRFAIKCISSLEYIHKHDVIHGEIRPEGEKKRNFIFFSPIYYSMLHMGS